ncbi:hypothetical protein HKD37_02G004827 [Glycine soja]
MSEKRIEREGVSLRGEGDKEWTTKQRRKGKSRVNQVTFYFMHFPDAYLEEELHKVFSYWGFVKEVFMVPRRNKGGLRFGFVTFKRFADERQLEHQLDHILIRNMKIQVNISKFGKKKMDKINKIVGESKRFYQNTEVTKVC